MNATVSVEHPTVQTCMDQLQNDLISGTLHRMAPEPFEDAVHHHDTQLLLVAGPKRHGKDTFCNAIQTNMPDGTVSRFAFADRLKDVILRATNAPENWLYGDESEREMPRDEWSDKNHPPISARQLSQTFGTEGAQKRYGKNIWADIWRFDVAQSRAPLIIAPDARFDHEAQIVARLNTYQREDSQIPGVVARVYRSDRMHALQSDAHISERGLSDHLVHREYICASIEDNQRRAREMCDLLLDGRIEQISAINTTQPLKATA